MLRQLKSEELQRPAPEIAAEQTKMPVVLVLDNVRSALNVGSVFRTSDAFNVASLALCGITCAPPHREIMKTALGATASVAWQYYEHTSDAIAALKQEGFQIIAIEQTDKSLPLQQFTPRIDQKYALILGNEVSGVSPEVLALCDEAIEIPQVGAKHSLNVSVCAGVVAWHFFQSLVQL